MDDTNATPGGSMPGRLIAILGVLGLEGLAFAGAAFAKLGSPTLYSIAAACDVVLVVALLARSEAARMVVQGLVALGAIVSLVALVSGDLLAIFGLGVRAAVFFAIGSEQVRRWTAEAEMPRHFSDVVLRRRRRS